MTEQNPGAGNQPGPETPTEAYTPPSHEQASEATATSRVGTAPRPGAGRWAIALGIVAVMIGVTAAVAFLLTGQAAPSAVLGYTPPDSIVYTELRLDLPGDQRQKVGAFLSKFPGFDDQSTLDAKIADVLDRIVGKASDRQQSYTRDIQPWFGGEIGVAVGELPAPDAREFDGRFLALVSVSDATVADAWFKELTADAHGTTTTYAGTELTTFADEFRSAYAIAGGEVMLLGDETSVKASLDTGGRSGFASADGMAAARAGIKGDHVGFMYLDVASYIDWFQAFAEQAGDMGTAFDESMRAYVPDWMAGAIRAEDDGLAFDTLVPHLDANPITENRLGDVAAHLPPTTIVAADGHDLGRAIKASLEVYRDNPETADALRQLEEAMGVLGGPDAVLDWMGDGAMAIVRTEDGVEGGVVVVPTDAAAAQRLFATLKSFAALGGAQMGFEVREETHAGVTITIIDLGDLSQLGGGLPIAGAPAQVPVEGTFELAFAVTDGAAIVGANPGFVRAVIDADAGASLADDARYRGLVERVGAQNAGSVFVDLTAIRELVEEFAGSMGADLATYERDIKPYLLPFDAIVGATIVGQDVDASHVLITVE